MKRINLCFSGGRTSAYMVEFILKNQLENDWFYETEFIVTFANTGREHDKTLGFVNNCFNRWEKLYFNNGIWLESVVQAGRKPCSHKVVSYESASKEGEVFEEVVKKYGIPNQNFLHCTRELKENPILSYMESLGETKGHIENKKFIPATYETWIGIRADEPRRLGGNMNGVQKKVYPLNTLGIVKQTVLDFWEGMPFDLDIPEHLGNCIDCHKKTENKLFKVARDMGTQAFDFPAHLDTTYDTVNAQVKDGVLVPRKRFRGYRSTNNLIALFKESKFNPKDYDGETVGCENSCEPFMGSNELVG